MSGNPEAVKYITCPECGKELRTEQDGMKCDRHSFCFMDGYYDLCPTDFYYGEIPREQMQEILQASHTMGTGRALGKYLAALDDPAWSDFLAGYISDPRRHSWIYLTQLSQRKRVLDLGCGWGTLLFPLASVYEQAVGMDMTGERLEYAALRTKELGLDNVTLIKGGMAERLPFADNSFDLVVLNGVLEWIPESLCGDPRDVQKGYLEEVRRILKPSGQVYIGIENRLSYTYFLCRPEDHTGLRLGALLPRGMANIYSHLRRKKPYRTYTYSKAGYEHLLSEAGFTCARVYPVLPDYRFPEAYMLKDHLGAAEGELLIPHRSRTSLKRSVLFPLAAASGVLSKLTHSFSIVGGMDDNHSMIEQALNAHSFDLNDVSLGMNTAGECLAILAQSAVDGAFFKFPLTKKAAIRLGQAESNIKVIHKAIPHLKALVPMQQAQALNGIVYSISPLVKGQNILLAGFNDTYENQAVQFIEEFHSMKTQYCDMSAETIRRILLVNIEPYLNSMKSLRPVLVENLLKIIERMSGRMEGLPIAIGYCHGDYHAANIMVHDGKISGIIDWDRFCDDGVQDIDALYFKIFKEAEVQGKTASEIILSNLLQYLPVRDSFNHILLMLKIIRLYADVSDGSYFPITLLDVWDKSCSALLARMT